jgi:UDP-2,4-diacetamido-2,4,6-trideoxy-beta-L-altropyranose hydrolase
MKNILFRADSSSSIGTGHIMRDLVLAKYYPNSKIIFATQNLEGNLNAKITEEGYDVVKLNSNDIDEVLVLIKTHSIDMIVIDHYGINWQYEKTLKETYPLLKILSFDDTYEKHYCDILLNHNIYADKSKYLELVPKNCELRCGQKYTLLRDEFMEAKENINKLTKSKKSRIFIAMGGADTANLNPKIIQLLESFNNIIVEIVTSTANRHIDELKSLVRNKKWINLHINSLEIGELMARSDFAIVTPSVTLNEVWYMELPFIAIKTADNQKYMCGYLEEKNLAILDNFNSYILGKQILTYMKNLSMLEVAYVKIDILLSKYDKNRIFFQKSKTDKKKLWINFFSRNTDG